MKRYALSILILLPFILTIISCGKRPSYVLSKDKMVDVLYDIQLVQAITDGSMHRYESYEYRERLLRNVYEKNGITKSILDSSLMWYSDNIELYMEINDSVTSKLNKKQTEIREVDNKLRSEKDTLDDILPSHFYLDRNKYVYSFVLDSIKLKRLNIDDFQLQFDVRGLDEKTQKVESAVYFMYQDTSVQNKVLIEKDSHYILHKPQLSNSNLVEIKGYIRLKGSKSSKPVLIYNTNYRDTITSETNFFPFDRDDLANT